MRSPLKVTGAFVLTLAFIVLISGIWCYALSPTMDYTKYIDHYQYSPSIEGLASRSITFSAEKDETIDVSIGSVSVPPPFPSMKVDKFIVEGESRIDVKVYDPDGELIWQELNVTYSHFRSKVLKSGSYTLEIKNLGVETITIQIYVSRSLKTSIRPLEPAGQWLSLISLPIFGFGIWMFAIERKEE